MGAMNSRSIFSLRRRGYMVVLLWNCISRCWGFQSKRFATASSSHWTTTTTTTTTIQASTKQSSSSSTTISSSTTTTTTKTKAMRRIQGIRDLIDHFDIFLLDMWGVLHDGHQPYEGVLETIRQLKAAGKQLVILSNSSKRQDNSIHMLRKLGFDPTDFHPIITSGEVAYAMMGGTDSPLHSMLLHSSQTVATPTITSSTTTTTTTTNINIWPPLVNPATRKAVVLGSGDGDEEYLNACGWAVAPIQEASLVVARGTFTVQLKSNYSYDKNDGATTAAADDDDDWLVHKRKDPLAYEVALTETLQACAARRLPMLVTNPDKIRPDDERPPMPGKIGDAYEAALAQAQQQTQQHPNEKSDNNEDDNDPADLVKRVGKPFADVYRMALQDNVDRSRVCMVGDALETDITGGNLAGIATVWVLMDGIHAPDIGKNSATNNGDSENARAEAVLRDFAAQAGQTTYAQRSNIDVQPDYLIDHFRW